MFSRKAVACLALLCGLIVVVAYPRFNRHDLPTARSAGGGEPLNLASDARAYVATVAYFRGAAPRSSMQAPFAYRVLAPFVASRLPFPPQTSLNVLNEFCLMAAMVLIYAFMARLGIGFPARIAASGLFAVSFPTFCYGAIGYVDPALVLFVAAALHLIVSNRLIAFAAATALASGIRETALLVLLPAAAFLHARGELFGKKSIVFIVTIPAYFLAYRLYQDWTLGSQPYGGWGPTLQALAFNLGRPRSAFSMLLTFGIPGTLALFAWKRAPEPFRAKRAEMAALRGGVLAGLMLSLYSVFGSAADGRMLWTIYPFAVPLAGITIQGWLDRAARKDGAVTQAA
jgi:hypothetical protein